MTYLRCTSRGIKLTSVRNAFTHVSHVIVWEHVDIIGCCFGAGFLYAQSMYMITQLCVPRRKSVTLWEKWRTNITSSSHSSNILPKSNLRWIKHTKTMLSPIRCRSEDRIEFRLAHTCIHSFRVTKSVCLFLFAHDRGTARKFVMTLLQTNCAYYAVFGASFSRECLCVNKHTLLFLFFFFTIVFTLNVQLWICIQLELMFTIGAKLQNWRVCHTIVCAFFFFFFFENSNAPQDSLEQ